MKKLTLADYFGPYKNHQGIKPEHRQNAEALLALVNAALADIEAAGVKLATDPDTACHISGNGNGGWRPEDCLTGRKNSTHKTGNGVDISDPFLDLGRYIVGNPDRLEKWGLYIESPKATAGWIHFQRTPPGSGRRIYLP